MANNKHKKRNSGLSRKRKTLHWKDADEMHKTMHRLPGYVRALLLEFIDNPMNYEQVLALVDEIEFRMTSREKRKHRNTDVKRDMNLAVECGVFKYREGKYELTLKGTELARYMAEVIPYFFEGVLSEKAASFATIAVHVVLSFFKLFFGVVSHSAGLVSDGIDNTVDTVSSVAAWFGIKFDKVKIVSVFIIVMMFLSVAGVIITSVNKILNPMPVKEGQIAFVISIVSGIIMLLLSAYQYITGKKRMNFAILCQSVDSRNHFLTSILVCLGIATSYIAEISGIGILQYFDAVVGLIIGILILKSAVELIVEFQKPEGEETKVSHFIGKSQEKNRQKLVYEWLSDELQQQQMSYEELVCKFEARFKRNVPRVFTLSGFGYLPKTKNDLQRFLDLFVKEGKLFFHNNRYSAHKRK